MHNPRRRVPADHARLAITALRHDGLNLNQIAALAGTSHVAVARISSGKRTQCEAHIATAIVGAWVTHTTRLAEEAA